MINFARYLLPILFGGLGVAGCSSELVLRPADTSVKYVYTPKPAGVSVPKNAPQAVRTPISRRLDTAPTPRRFGAGALPNVPGLSMSSTTALNPALMYIYPQASTNADGNGGTLSIRLPGPSGTGSPGYISIDPIGAGGVAGTGYLRFPYGGLTLFSKNSGGTDWPILQAVDNNVYLADPSVTSSVYIEAGYTVDLHDGYNDSIIASQGSVQLAPGNVYSYCATSSSVQFFNNCVQDAGSGVLVTSVGKATTNPSASSTGSIFYSDSSTGDFAIKAPAATSASIDVGATVLSINEPVVHNLISSGNGSYTDQLAETTTNNTPNTSTVFAIPANTKGNVTVIVNASVPSSTGGLSQTWVGNVTNNGGSCAVMATGGTFTLQGTAAYTTISTATVSVGLSSCNVVVTETGVAATTIDWLSTIQYLSAS